MKLALFDMGSNSIRLLLGTYKNNEWHNESKYIWTTRLGKRDSNGDLTEESKKMTLNAFREGTILAKKYGATVYRALATGVMREASNAYQFAKEVEDLYNVPVIILTTEQEANLGFLGAVEDIELEETEYMLIDIGGSTTEIAFGDKNKMQGFNSYKVGAVRLQELSEIDKNEIHQYCKELWRKNEYSDNPTVVGIGGTATTIAAMHMRLTEYDPKLVHGHKIKKEWIRTQQEYLRSLSTTEIKLVPGIHPKRADIIVAGIDILLSAMDYYGIESIIISEKDGLEGAQKEMMSSWKIPTSLHINELDMKVIADIEDKVIETIKSKNLINEGDAVLVGCSGGPDSMALLNILNQYRKQCNFKLGAVCVDHRIRLQGISEVELVRKYAKKHNIEFWGFSEDIPRESLFQKESMETVGRQVRYKQFDTIMVKYGYNKLALGHHKDDQAETILAHIIRGSGLSGLKGMQYKELNKIRPLMNVTKKELLRYIESAKIIYAWDNTNDETEYARNKLRLQVIPQLAKINPNILESLCRLGEIATLDENYLNESAKKALSKIVKQFDENHDKPEIILDKEIFKQYNKAIRYRVWREVSKYYFPYGTMPTLKNIKDMDKLMFLQGKKQFFLKWMKIYVQYDKIYVTQFFKEERNSIAKKSKTLEPLVKQNVIVKKIDTIPDKLLKGQFVIPKIIADKGLCIRERQPGDIIVICNKESFCIGHKKLKKFLIDRKIPVEKRNTMLWLVAGETVLCEVDKGKKFMLRDNESQDYVIGSF